MLKTPENFYLSQLIKLEFDFFFLTNTIFIVVQIVKKNLAHKICWYGNMKRKLMNCTEKVSTKKFVTLCIHYQKWPRLHQKLKVFPTSVSRPLCIILEMIRIRHFQEKINFLFLLPAFTDCSFPMCNFAVVPILKNPYNVDKWDNDWVMFSVIASNVSFFLINSTLLSIENKWNVSKFPDFS